jgi:hypothetical protein
MVRDTDAGASRTAPGATHSKPGHGRLDMGNTVGRDPGPQPLRKRGITRRRFASRFDFSDISKLAVLSSLPAANRDLDK